MARQGPTRGGTSGRQWDKFHGGLQPPSRAPPQPACSGSPPRTFQTPHDAACDSGAADPEDARCLHSKSLVSETLGVRRMDGR